MNINQRQRKWLFSIVIVIAAVVLAVTGTVGGDVAVALIAGAGAQNAANRAIGRPE